MNNSLPIRPSSKFFPILYSVAAICFIYISYNLYSMLKTEQKERMKINHEGIEVQATVTKKYTEWRKHGLDYYVDYQFTPIKTNSASDLRYEYFKGKELYEEQFDQLKVGSVINIKYDPRNTANSQIYWMRRPDSYYSDDAIKNFVVFDAMLGLVFWGLIRACIWCRKHFFLAV